MSERAPPITRARTLSSHRGSSFAFAPCVRRLSSGSGLGRRGGGLAPDRIRNYVGALLIAYEQTTLSVDGRADGLPELGRRRETQRGENAILQPEDAPPFWHSCVDASVRASSQIRLVYQRLATPTLDGELRKRLEVRAEDLDALIPRIGHVDAALSIDGDAHGLAELPRRAALGSERLDERPVLVEHLDALVACVSH